MDIVFSLDTFFLHVFQAPQQLFNCQMVQVNLTLNAVDCSFTQASTLISAAGKTGIFLPLSHKSLMGYCFHHAGQVDWQAEYTPKFMNVIT